MPDTPAHTPAGVSGPVEHRVTAADAGSTVRAAVGDSVVVEVPENATTGYEWVVSVDGPAEISDDQRLLPEQLAPGAGGTRRVALRVTGAGRSTVRLAKQRLWEAGRPPIETVELAIDAR